MREILCYLIEQPNAKDTTKGILKWWMPRGRYDQRGKSVQETLNYLVLQGMLTTQAMDTQRHRTFYESNEERLEEIKEF